MTTSRISRALGLLALLAASAAQATPIASSCALTDIAGGLATDCLGYAKDIDSLSSLQSLVGQSTWHGMTLTGLTQYKDNSVGVGSDTTLFDLRQAGADASQGTVTFLQSIVGPAVLTLKGGPNWAAYYLPNGAAAGTIIRFDIPGVQGAGLSHASVYTAARPTTSPPAPSAPEPSGLALVLLALAGAAGSTLRRRHRG